MLTPPGPIASSRISLRRLLGLLTATLLSVPVARALHVADVQRSVISADSEVSQWILTSTHGAQQEFAQKVVDDPSLVVHSSGIYGVPATLYNWAYDEVIPLAEFGNHLGDSYQIERSGEGYHGSDGKGLNVEFVEAFRSATEIIYTGDGSVTVMGIPSSGQFVNVIRFTEIEKDLLDVEAYVYVRVTNGFKRFMAKVVFAISDIEETIKEKLFELDGTVIKALRQLLDDPSLLPVISQAQTPEELAAGQALAAKASLAKAPDSPTAKKSRKRGSRRRRDKAPTQPRAKSILPVLDGPLELTSLETTWHFREELSPESFNYLVGILRDWYAPSDSS